MYFDLFLYSLFIGIGFWSGASIVLITLLTLAGKSLKKAKEKRDAAFEKEKEEDMKKFLRQIREDRNTPHSHSLRAVRPEELQDAEKELIAGIESALQDIFLPKKKVPVKKTAAPKPNTKKVEKKRK